MSKSHEQGLQIQKVLVERGLESPVRDEHQHYGFSISKVEDCMWTILHHGLRLDTDDDSLRNTPRRIAKMYCEEIFYGLDYQNFPSCSTFENKMKADEMVAHCAQVRSMCEHHFVPFIGMAYLAYLPKHKIIGLSKLNRVVDFFSRRPQVQERLTEQVCCALQHILDTEDVAVVIQATHFCVQLRGIQDHTSKTTTSKLGGRFRTVPELRGEFIALTRSK